MKTLFALIFTARALHSYKYATLTDVIIEPTQSRKGASRPPYAYTNKHTHKHIYIPSGNILHAYSCMVVLWATATHALSL